MPGRAYHLEIITPERSLFSDKVISLVAPALDGYVGIWFGHVPYITPLSIGEVALKDESGRFKIMAISGGFLEVTREKVSVLADTCELAEEIDIDRAKTAEDRATKRLSHPTEDVDLARARLALEKARSRRKAFERAKDQHLF